MAARKTIAKLGSNPGKQEEMDFLKEITASLESGAYLASLFSEDMVKWACAQIRLDMCCDLWGALNHAQERALAEGCRAADQEKAANALIADFKVETIATQDRVEEYHEKLARAEEKCQLLKDRWNDALEGVKAVQDDVYHAKTEIDRLNGEVVQLKAKLYDMMVGAR